MATLTRKQREIQEREARILALARPMLLQQGYQGLSMDRLAAEMEYAKGTIYNHFPNKEEIVVALATESIELRRKLLEAASMLRSSSRERMSAICCACDLYSTEFSQHFEVELLLRNAVIWQKSSVNRQQLVRRCELRCMDSVVGIVRDAVASEDLKLPTCLSPEEFIFGFWSLVFGSLTLMASSSSLGELGIENPMRSVRYHGWTLMNGYAWQPLVDFESSEVVMRDIYTELRDRFVG